MIFIDQSGFPVDETSDGGDSAMRIGMLTSTRFEVPTELTSRLHYYEKQGLCVRHPLDIPWNNEKNFTRDQLMPLTAGFYFTDRIDKCKRIFWSRAKSFFFAQNSERDYKGSTKYPYPHTFINDKGLEERRAFDFADPLMPDHIWHLIKCAKLYPLYVFAIVGLPWFVLSVLLHARSSHKEHNQIIAMCRVQGRWSEKLFMRVTPNWKQDLRQYWGVRNEIEYAELIIRSLEDV